MTRASTPASLSTRTEIVALRRLMSGMMGSMVAAGAGSRPRPPRANAQEVMDGSGQPWRLCSDQHEAFVGDAGGLVLVLGTEDHLIVRGTRGDHREAVLLRVHRDVGDHRAVGCQHLADHVVDLLDAFRAQA